MYKFLFETRASIVSSLVTPSTASAASKLTKVVDPNDELVLVFFPTFLLV